MKYNQSIIESYNLKPESDERTVDIVELCQNNLSLVNNEYGELSLYCIRILYTLFTARLHEETGEGSQQVLRKLGMVKHDGQQVKAN